ncbi:MAG: uracil-DNA glycosylase [Rhodobacteraceae bacterium]|nr:uracil-DNA glycosylase [Paracoccaceae bacterium]
MTALDLSGSTARQLVEWCLETGAEEPIGDTPVNRFIPSPRPAAAAITADMRKPVSGGYSQPIEAAPGGVRSAGTLVTAEEVKSKLDEAVAAAEELAKSADSLEALRCALQAYPHCGLKEKARNLVFSDGNPGARVMIVGEAPGAEEDRTGRPFVGQAGQLLDKMFAEIGLDRSSENGEQSLYITNVLPWRPPGNRNPESEEMAMMKPFLDRHIELVRPELLVPMGNHSCWLLIQQRGITRLRGHWFERNGIPVMPMFHPAYLLRSPSRKGDSWIDLLMIRQKLAET